MRLVAFSDSHGHTSDLRAALRLATERGKIDACAFLGDGLGDFEQIVPLLQAHNPRMDIRAVAGNNDYCFFGEPTRAVIDLGGVKVLCVHGHLLGVRQGLSRLSDEAKALGASVGLFGHTHQSAVEQVGGVLLVNPGAVCERASGKPAYAEIIVKENGSVHVGLPTF